MKANDVLLIVALLIVSSGCGEAPPAETPTMVYYDTETKGPVVAEPSERIPAIHPETGRATLVPAAYCEACDAWHPTPPLEEIQRNPKALSCPKTGQKLSFTGPKLE
jgi:hypothetical protein